MIWWATGSVWVPSPLDTPPVGPTYRASGTACMPTGSSGEWTAAANRASARPGGRSLRDTPAPGPLEIGGEVRSCPQACTDEVGEEVVDIQIRHQYPQRDCRENESAERDHAEANKAALPGRVIGLMKGPAIIQHEVVPDRKRYRQRRGGGK